VPAGARHAGATTHRRLPRRAEEGEGGRGGAGGALTRDGAAVKQPGDGGKAAVMKVHGGGSSGVREEERRAVWGAAR
jgi:hypothetical protein